MVSTSHDSTNEKFIVSYGLTLSNVHSYSYAFDASCYNHRLGQIHSHGLISSFSDLMKQKTISLSCDSRNQDIE